MKTSMHHKLSVITVVIYFVSSYVVLTPFIYWARSDADSYLESLVTPSDVVHTAILATVVTVIAAVSLHKRRSDNSNM